MKPVTRPYTDADREGFGRVRSVTYRGGEPVLPDEKLLRDDCLGFVCEVDDEIIGASTVLDMTANKGSAHLRCAGLAAVAVAPERRKGGFGSSMMADILPQLREQGFVLASLYPFRETFYRRFGYATCGNRLLITCPQGRMPKVASPLQMRRLKPSQRTLIEDCYERFAARYAGMNKRGPDQWWRTLGGDKPLEIYAAGDPIEAYVVLRLRSDFWETQVVKEVAWTSFEGYAAILSLFGGLCMNHDAVEWWEPSDSPFLYNYIDQGVKITANRQIMYRLLDVRSALESLVPQGTGQFTFSVTDAQIAENDGAWRVCYAPGEIRVERSTEASMRLTIGQLSQAFMGEPSLESLLRTGLVASSDAGEAKAACALLAPQPVYCADLF